MPYNPITDKIDTAAVSADGSTYTNPQYMTTIVSGGAGNHEDESRYVKSAQSYTGMENYGCVPRPPSCGRARPLNRTPFPSLPRAPRYGYWQAINSTVAKWTWHTVKKNVGPADWSDALTIVQDGRGH